MKIKSKAVSLFFILMIYSAAMAAGFIVLKLFSGYNLLLSAFLADLTATIFVFLFSLIFNNSSVYDPYWSVIPVPLFLFWALSGMQLREVPVRVYLILGAILFWSVRLTLNWITGWKGLSHEDWRYCQFREKTGKLYWIVSLLGIHIFPTIMVFGACIPAYAALVLPGRGVNGFDFAAAAVCLAGTGFELFGDLQLRRHIRSNPEKPVESGLWKYSRHPNYFGEILFWTGIFLFAAASDPNRYWMGLFPVGMLFMFLFFSVPAMEKRQTERRPEYRKIMETVSSLVPLKRKVNTRPGKSLSSRKGDILYVVIFTFFMLTSFITDSLNGINRELLPDSGRIVEEFIYNFYAAEADPALIVNQPTVRISAGISAFLWGPLYVFFIVCFVKGWNILKNWGFLYGAALTSSMILYMAEGLFGAHASPEPVRYLVTNGAYFLVPLSMIFRMWKKEPFGAGNG